MARAVCYISMNIQMSHLRPDLFYEVAITFNFLRNSSHFVLDEVNSFRYIKNMELLITHLID